MPKAPAVVSTPVGSGDILAGLDEINASMDGERAKGGGTGFKLTAQLAPDC